MRNPPSKDRHLKRPSSRPPGRRNAPAKGARAPTQAGPAPRPKASAFASGRVAKRKPPCDRSLEKGAEESHESSQRIAKVIARAGLCSRRTAESWISEGRVALNGALATGPAVNVGPADKISVDGEPLAQRARTRLFLFHKPRGLVSTARDPDGRPTIFDYLREHWPDGPRVVSVGRLDINTEGLLLLTNDGGLARVLELPSTGWVRRYRVRANGAVDPSMIERLQAGMTIDGMTYGAIEATLDRVQGANNWLTLSLREGKNREIKRVLEHFGLIVNRLIRLSFGPFQLGELAEGKVEEVRTRVLRDQLGPSLAKAAGVDFSSPAEEQREVQELRRPQKPQARGQADRERGPRQQRYGEKPPVESAPSPERRIKPVARPRKHISALRAEENAERGAARIRVERRETEDRSGRTVQVERLVAAEPARARRGEAQSPAATRNGRRFEAERKTREGAPDERRRRRADAAPASQASRAPKSSRPQREGAHGAGSRAPKRFDDRPRREGPRKQLDGAGSARSRKPSLGGKPVAHGGPRRGGGAGKRPPKDKR